MKVLSYTTAIVACLPGAMAKHASLRGLEGHEVSSVCSTKPFGQPRPACSHVPYTHAHNDYEHPNPLFDALSYGFTSGESDIFLYENDSGNLRVAHDPVDDPTNLTTIEEWYLDPLVNLYHYHDNGGIYANAKTFHLLVDFKTEGNSTYERLHEVLEEYAMGSPGFLTTYVKVGDGKWDVLKGAVDVTISGDRPFQMMYNQNVRYASYDGRASDIGSGMSPDFIHLLSDNWNTFFGDFDWDGVGDMPEEIIEEVQKVVDEVHLEGRLIRFWNLPNDAENVWGPLVAAGVDFINTDRLEPLATFVKADIPDLAVSRTP